MEAKNEEAGGGGLVIMCEIRETLTLFMRLVTERDMLHEKDYIAKITKAREDEDSVAFQRECQRDSTNLHNFTSREVSLEEREILYKLRGWLCT